MNFDFKSSFFVYIARIENNLSDMHFKNMINVLAFTGETNPKLLETILEILEEIYCRSILY